MDHQLYPLAAETTHGPLSKPLTTSTGQSWLHLAIGTHIFLQNEQIHLMIWTNTTPNTQQTTDHIHKPRHQDNHGYQ